MKSLKYLALSLPFLFVALLPVALAADDPAPEKMPEAEYYPLKPNTVWTYKIGENKFKLKAEKEEKFDGKPSVRVVMVGDGPNPVTYENMQVTKEGVFRLGFEGNKAEPPVKIMSVPPKADDKWDVKSTIGKETLKGTFKMGKEDKVKVPAGEYDTYYTESEDLDANGMKVTFKQYFAKGVGMVKEEITIGSQKIVIELEKFEEGKESK